MTPPQDTCPPLEALGWPLAFMGELDHRRLKAPTLKLRSARQGAAGDWVYCIDLRVRRPNRVESLSSTELHSMEHFLLEGLQRHLGARFVSIGVMGCGTGFYLVFLNEGRASVLCAVLARILQDMAQASAVPYARVDQCGSWQDHSLEAAQRIAREILAAQGQWLDAAHS